MQTAVAGAKVLPSTSTTVTDAAGAFRVAKKQIDVNVTQIATRRMPPIVPRTRHVVKL